MTVKLRRRSKGKMISLYLEYYSRGKKSYDYLQLYLYPKSSKLTREQKEHNKEIELLAESIKAQRYLQIKNGQFGFQDKHKLNASFYKYIESLAEKRKESKGNYENWNSTLKHLRMFQEDATFAEVDAKWLLRFKEHLQTTAKTPAKVALAENSQCSYFNKVRAALKQAVKDEIILKNPAELVPGIKPGDHEREFLTHEELQAIAKVDCEIPIIKRAFLFSALTGLRWSDIQKLTWAEVQHSRDNGYYLRFIQQKTKGVETLPISQQAYLLLGERGEPSERVFVGLKYSAWHNLKLQQWVMRGGISKTITFHCARHTNATLHLTLGTDIYTVSKMLGHKQLKTTQIYARIIDMKKKEAAEKIKLSL
jgi:integrase